MSTRYQETTDGIGPRDLQGFFVGWRKRPSPEAHLEILKGSDFSIMAVSGDRRVVGFVTAITDGRFLWLHNVPGGAARMAGEGHRH